MANISEVIYSTANLNGGEDLPILQDDEIGIVVNMIFEALNGSKMLAEMGMGTSRKSSLGLKRKNTQPATQL